MTHEPRLDDRTVEWLRGGPERIPDRVLAAADAHARSHPRHRLDARRTWRTLMSQLRLVRDDDLGEVRAPRARVALAVVAVVALVAIGGFAAGTRWERDDRSAVAPPVASAAVADAVTLAASCEEATPATESVTGGITRIRGSRLLCDATSADPRLAGSLVLYPSTDLRADGTGDTWGEISLRAGDGRWSGAYSGTVDPAGFQHLTGVMFGSGPFGGLQLRLSATAAPDGLELVGEIVPADRPAGAGDQVLRRVVCESGGAAGTESMDPGGVNHVKGRSMVCTVDASDRRLAGTAVLVASIDEQPDQSARIGGSESMVNEGGAWIGTWSGTYDTGWTTHRWTGTVSGSGAYAGLEYRFTTIGEWPRFVQVGVMSGGG